MKPKVKLGAGMTPLVKAAKKGKVPPRNEPVIATKTKGAQPGTTAAMTTVQMAKLNRDTIQGGGLPPMPPFNPNTPEQWMLEAASRAWQKYPERAMQVGLRQPPYMTATDEVTPGAPMPPTHTSGVVSPQRVMQYLLARFNPNRGLTPQVLSNYLDQWSLGFLRWFSLSWDRMAQTDDQIRAVKSKREFSVARLRWEIVCDDEKDPQAQEQRLALEAFYDNLSCTHCLDQNEQGGVNLLIRQMMRAIGDKWAVHEIVWRPFTDAAGKIQYTADFRFVPLWFFENRTGQLRYLPYELALDGIPLDAGGWLITSGDGLNFATAIAYMFKQLGLKDWARYSEKFGIPTLIGKAAAAFGSAEFNELVSALGHLNSDGVIVVNKNNEIDTLAPHAASGSLPQEKLCDRMDRAIARLWRGGDLSTMSRGGEGGVGALPQIQQEDEIAEADCHLLSEALNFYVDRWVIRYLFGAAQQKARFRIIPAKNIDNAKEIETYQFALAAGVPISKKSIREKFDLPEPNEGDELAVAPPPTPPKALDPKQAAQSGPGGLGNDIVPFVSEAG